MRDSFPHRYSHPSGAKTAGRIVAGERSHRQSPGKAAHDCPLGKTVVGLPWVGSGARAGGSNPRKAGHDFSNGRTVGGLPRACVTLGELTAPRMARGDSAGRLRRHLWNEAVGVLLPLLHVVAEILARGRFQRRDRHDTSWPGCRIP